MTINGVTIRNNERLDDLHRNGYLIIQDPESFCFGSDAVLLSGFVNIRKNETVLDLGTGTGIIPILLAAKTLACGITGLEIQEKSVEMARRSVELNGLSDKIKILNGDIRELTSIFRHGSFDCVTANPPYMNVGGGIVGEALPKSIARHEILCTLRDVVYGAAAVLRFGGRFYMVHRPARLIEIINCLVEHKMEPKTLRFVHPFIDRPPVMVLVEAVRGGGSMLKIMPPLIIYQSAGVYTEETRCIYYGDGE